MWAQERAYTSPIWYTLYRKLDEAGQDATLGIYEGMWHVFQQFPLPETEVAVRKSAAFINEHLR